MSLALCKDIVMLEQKSTEFSGMSLYGVALRLVFTGVTGMAKPGMVVSTYFWRYTVILVNLKNAY